MPAPAIAARAAPAAVQAGRALRSRAAAARAAALITTAALPLRDPRILRRLRHQRRRQCPGLRQLPPLRKSTTETSSAGADASVCRVPAPATVERTAPAAVPALRALRPRAAAARSAARTCIAVPQVRAFLAELDDERCVCCLCLELLCVLSRGVKRCGGVGMSHKTRSHITHTRSPPLHPSFTPSPRALGGPERSRRSR